MPARPAARRRRRPLRHRLQDLARQPNPTGSSTASSTAALDPFRGYANAIRDELPDAVAVLDAFHVVRLGTQVVDEVRRRVQQDTLGRRGHKHDPLYKIRGLLRHGVEHLTETPAGQAQPLPRRRRPRRRGQRGLAVLPAAPLHLPRHPGEGPRDRRARSSTASPPARSPRSPGSAAPCAPGEPRCWPTSTPSGVSNGGTEAINLIIEKVRRLAHGFRDFDHYRLRILLAADGRRPYRTRPNHA